MTVERRTVLSPKLVIFDCDGVLVDSDPLIRRALGRVLATYGLQLQPDELRTYFRGTSNSRLQDIAMAHWGVSLPDDIADVLEDAERVAVEEGLRAVPGVADVVRLVSASGMATCVASNGSPDAVEQRLKLTGLYPFVCGTAVQRRGRSAQQALPRSVPARRGDVGVSAFGVRRHRGQRAGDPSRSGSGDEGIGVRGRTGHGRRRLGRCRTVHGYGVAACVARAVGQGSARGEIETTHRKVVVPSS